MQYAIGLDDHATHPHTVLRADGSVEARFSSEDAARRTADALNGASRTDSAPTKRVRHYDRRPLGKHETTSIGGLRALADITQAGVFDYHDAAGNVIREYRPLTEIASKRALDSMRDMPVTIGHPPEGVTGDSFKRLAVGHVSGTPSVVDGRVRAELVVQDAKASKAVRDGALVEHSCGYDCALAFTPGLTGDGVEFDAVQSGHIFNHDALLEEGAARLGPEMSFVNAGKDAGETIVMHFAGLKTSAEIDALVQGAIARRPTSMKTITIAGIQYPADSEAASQAAAKVEAEAAQSKAEAAAANGKLDSLTKQLEDMAAQIALMGKADEARRLDAVKARVQPLFSVAPDFTSVGTELEVLQRAALAVDPKLRLGGKDLAYFQSYVDHALDKHAKRAASRNDGLSQIRQAVSDAAHVGPTEHRIDGSGAAAQAAYEQMHRDIYSRQRFARSGKEG